MVCLGNICRSPMAEGILQHAAYQRGITLEIDSAGTSAYHVGDAPDPRGQATLLQHGVDISGQHSRQIRTSDFTEFDLILAADASNFQDLKAAAPLNQTARIEFMLDADFPDENRGVPDPYYGGQNGFEEVYELLNSAMVALLDREF